jgi:hypothetical protein
VKDDIWTSVPGQARRRRFGLAVLSVAVFGIAISALLWGLLAAREDAPTDANAVPRPLGSPPSLSLAHVEDVLPQDGIPAIDEPKFAGVAAIDWLDPQEPVIALEVNGESRAYPLQILTWHEVVNDEIAGVPVVVTFCPLCNTAYAFERPEIDGKVTTFGVSGKLYFSNLLMYDRATGSLWPQALGVAGFGEVRGLELERVPAQIVSWEEFRTNFPDGEVLTRDTGHDRSYGENPYPGYDDVDSRPFLFKGETDGRLAAIERVLGVETDKEIMAFPYFRLQRLAKDGVAVVNTIVGKEFALVMWREGTTSALDKESIAESKDVGATAAFSRVVNERELTFAVEDGSFIDLQTRSRWNLFGRATSGPLEGHRLASLDAHDSFWFDWAAFHPETRVWQGGTE